MATTQPKPARKIAMKFPTKNVTEKASSDFAVIMTGGKQYIVHTGELISIEKMDGDFTPGKEFSFDEVLLTHVGSKTTVGTPTVSGSKVVAEFVEEGRDKKLVVVKYKAKSRYYKKNGHRQPFMTFKITKIA